MFQLVTLPPAGRLVVLPPEGGGVNSEIWHDEPPAFGPFDPTDIDTFIFDWSRRGYPNDAIVSAAVVSQPGGVNLGTPVIAGSQVEVTIGPFVSVPMLPASYLLRCTATFRSTRISTYSVPVQVYTL